MNILLNLFFVLAIFILIRYSSMKQMLKRLLLLCGLLALIVGAAALPEFLTPGYVVKIQACNEKNPAAEGTEIWLCEVVVNGVSHKPEEIFSPGWICERGFLIWRNYQRPEGMRDEIQAVFSGGEQVELVFQSNKWRGQVYLNTGKASQIIDCYSDTENENNVYRYAIPAATLSRLSSQKVVFGTLATLFSLMFLYRIWHIMCQRLFGVPRTPEAKGAVTTGNKPMTGNLTDGASRPRIFWLDCLKVLSALMIVLIHASGQYFNQTLFMSRAWWDMLWLNAVPRFAVPCFLMISGILYMQRKPSAQHSLKRAGHMTFVLFFWSIIFIVAKKMLWNGPENVITEILKIPFNQVTGSLWYGYALIWIFLLLPFWQFLYQNLTQWKKIHFIAVVLILPATLDFVGRYLALGDGGYAPFGSRILCLNYIGLLFLGAMLNEFFISHSRALSGILGFLLTMLGILLTILGSVHLASAAQITSHDFFGEIRLPSIIYGTGVLALSFSLSEINEKLIPAGIKSVIQKLSQLSLGIYFSHPLIIWCIPDLIIGPVFLSETGGAKDVLILTCIYFGLSVCGTFFMSELPCLKKMVQ